MGTRRAEALLPTSGSLSWLGELNLADFHGGDTGSHFYVEITYRAQIIEVALSFWVKPVAANWVIAGPGTLW